MKTAKPPAAAAEASSVRRSQPARQARSNPLRASAALNRAFGRDSVASGAGHEQPIDIFPAVTHFADAITALPKELVKHFTLLKEVDAKIHIPEQRLFQYVGAALSAPLPDRARSPNEGVGSVATASAPMSAQNSSSGVVVNGHVSAPSSVDESLQPVGPDPSDYPRRHLFQQVASEIKDMLVAMEEKNHVISSANEALEKQLARIDDIWPHLEKEFSEEAKWGSTTHWAYPENRVGRANNTQAERSRREAAANLSAAAQQAAEEAAARSDARKQAVAAKKNLKAQQQAQHQESDFDDHDAKAKGESTKKSGGGSKTRKGVESPAIVGLGISNAAPVNGNPPPKRRKVEKTPSGGAPTERAMSTVIGSGAAKPKTNSPRETPVPEGAPKKRKALPTGGNQSKKSRSGPGASPSVASSPVMGTIPDSAKVGRSSPAPTNAARPVSVRARQNSTTQPSLENGKPRPTSSASNKPNGAPPAAPEPVPQTNGTRPTVEKAKMPAAPPKADAPKQPEVEPPPTPSTVAPPQSAKKDTPLIKQDEIEAKETTPSLPITQTVTTKSGRASKPSTPALATFAEAARSRPARSSENNTNTNNTNSNNTAAGAGGATTTTTVAKRSHKKGASAAAAAAQALAAQVAGDSGNGNKQDEEEDPLYCYCNGVSYGEMIACDAEDCVREWFHLECVGLKVAPKGNVKWYCEDCKKRLKVGERKANGR